LEDYSTTFYDPFKSRRKNKSYIQAELDTKYTKRSIHHNVILVRRKKIFLTKILLYFVEFGDTEESIKKFRIYYPNPGLRY